MATVIGKPIRFAWDNHVTASGTTVSATNELASLPWSNVQNHIPVKAGRSSSVVNPFNINFTFDSAKAVQQFCMVGHGSSMAGSTLTLQGCDDGVFNTGAAIGVTYSSDILVANFSTEQTYQYWRLRVIPHPTTTYIEAGHAFLGPYEQFDFPDFATQINKPDPSVRVRSYGGSTTVFEKPMYRTVDFAVSQQDKADRLILETMYDTIGNRQAFYLFIDPTNKRDTDGLHKMTMLGFLSSPLSFSHMSMGWQTVGGFNFVESI